MRTSLLRSGGLAIVTLALVLMPLASYGEDKYWVGGTSGWWDDITNWSSPGQPQTGDNAYLTQSDAIDRTVEYRNSLDPAPRLGGLTVDATGSGAIGFLQALYSLSAEYETIGSSGSGTFTQTGGTNTVTNTGVGGVCWHPLLGVELWRHGHVQSGRHGGPVNLLDRRRWQSGHGHLHPDRWDEYDGGACHRAQVRQRGHIQPEWYRIPVRNRRAHLSAWCS